VKEMTDRGEAGLPFSGGFSGCFGRGFFKPQSGGFEDQIEAFPHLFQGFVMARYSRFLEARNYPKILGG
jgi:hypothetical protein